jgi:hypothetical protein
LEVAMKRHRGQPLPLEKKLQIVGVHQLEARSVDGEQSCRGPKRRTTTHQTAFGRSVDSTNSIIVSIVNSKKNKTVAHQTIKKNDDKQKEQRILLTSRELVTQCGKINRRSETLVRTSRTLSLSECFYFRSSINSFH